MYDVVMDNIISNLIQMEKCWNWNWKMLEKKHWNICGIVCKSDNLCHVHRKLNVFKFFTEEIRAETWIETLSHQKYI